MSDSDSEFPEDFEILPAASGSKQEGKTVEVEKKILDHNHRLKDNRSIIQCIGQVLSCFEQDDKDDITKFTGGTGTIIKRLDQNYVAILTCAHNVAKAVLKVDDNNDNDDDSDDNDDDSNDNDADSDEDEDEPLQEPTKMYFLPDSYDKDKSISNKKLKCVKWRYHKDFDPLANSDPYDLAVVICKDKQKYYANIDFASFIIEKYDKKKIPNSEIYGFPIQHVDPTNYLHGGSGAVKMMKTGKKGAKVKKYMYKINTYPGHSGAAIFTPIVDKSNELVIRKYMRDAQLLDNFNSSAYDKDTILTINLYYCARFCIYGVHVYGDVNAQVNWGVKFDQDKIKWIKTSIEEMEAEISEMKEQKIIDEVDDDEKKDFIVTAHGNGAAQSGIVSIPKPVKKVFDKIEELFFPTKTFQLKLEKISMSASFISKVKLKYKELDCLELVVNNENLMYFLAVQFKQKKSILAYLVDWYNKDKYQSESINLSVENWIKSKKFVASLNNDKAGILIGAIKAYNEIIICPLQLPPPYKISDDIKIVVNYFTAVQKLVCSLAKKEEKSPPFQVDLMITVKTTGSNSGDSINDINIQQRLSKAGCDYFPKQPFEIDASGKIDDEKLQKCIAQNYVAFSNRNNDDEKNSCQRVEIFIDRTDASGKDILTMFEPADCNKIPKDHLPEIYFQLRRKCLIPGEKSHITALHPLGGELIIFSFQVEAKDDIKCFLIWNGQTIRFYGQYIKTILPGLFENVPQEFTSDKATDKLDITLFDSIEKLQSKIDTEMSWNGFVLDT
eukprot:65123_1